MEECQKNEIISSYLSYNIVSMSNHRLLKKIIEPLSRMISSIWLVVKCLENLVIEKFSCYIEWLIKHLSVFGLRAIMTT